MSHADYPISIEAARAAIEHAKANRNPFGAVHPFNSLSFDDQQATRKWFHLYARGVVNLNGVVYAIAREQLWTVCVGDVD